jgi:hypothetical protein
VHTGFWWEDRWERNYLEDPDADGVDNIIMNVQEVEWRYGMN